ncbi:MAG: pantetheine-phosphate adenylyltransferase [Firmicutes bacterium]|nr:pantetheine-phosphate adenylyltransferase [Bacillota bacterium]
MTKAICPGSFDPVTMGHLDIITRASRIFEHLYVAVATNASKNPLFTVEQRIDLLNQVTGQLPNVEIITFSGLLVEAAREREAQVIVKGLRAISDFEYEFQMALMNKKIGDEIETLFLTTNSKYSFLSSSMVKEVARLDGCIRGLVPDSIHDIIQAQIKAQI